MAHTAGLAPLVEAVRSTVTAGRSAVILAPPGGGLTTALQEVAVVVEAGSPTQFRRFPDQRFPDLSTAPAGLTVIDDAHRATELQHLVIRDLALSGPIVLGSRVGAAPEALSWLWRSGLADRFDLGPLDTAAIESIIKQRLGGAVHWSLAAGLTQRSGGRPGFVVDEVDAMRAAGLASEAGFWRDRPTERISERLVERADNLLAELPESVADGVRIVAVAGSLAGSAADRYGVDGPALVRRGLAEWTVSNAVRLVPPSLAPAVRATLSPPYATATARRILDEQSDDLEPVDRARLRLDLGEPLELAEISAAAWAAIADRAPGSVPILARNAADRGAAGMMVAAELLTNVGNRTEAAEWYARIVDDETADPGTRAHAATEYASLLLWDLGRPTEAVRIAARLTEASSGGPFGAVALLHEASMLMYSGRPVEARDRLAGVDQSALDVTWGRVHDLVHVVTHSFVEPSVPSPDAVAALTAVADARVSATFGPTVGVIAAELAYEFAGAWADATALVAAARRDVRLDRTPLSAAWLALAEARAALAAGRLADATHAAAEAAASFADLNHASGLRWAVGAAVLASAQRGDFAGCRGHAARFDTLAPGVPFLDPDLTRAQAWGSWASGHHAVAAQRFTQAATAAALMGAPALEASALHDSYRALRSPVATRLAELAHAHPVPGIDLRARHVHLATAEQASELLVLAEEFAARGATLLGAEAAADAATIATKQGRRSTARDADGLRARLSSLCGDPRTPALAGRRTGQLTKRERDVAVRAAAGRSSRGIAEDLELSVRTIDNVLQRVYVKLGIHGRGELAPLLGAPEE